MHEFAKTCAICGVRRQALGQHIMRLHKISMKNYYDQYCKNVDDDKCSNENCSNENQFAGLTIGYRKHCSKSCANLTVDPIILANMQRSSFISKSIKAGYTEACFYIGIDYESKIIKIGASSVKRAKKRIYDSTSSNAYAAFSGTIQDVADFEYLIKTSFAADHEQLHISLLNDIYQLAINNDNLHGIIFQNAGTKKHKNLQIYQPHEHFQ